MSNLDLGRSVGGGAQLLGVLVACGAMGYMMAVVADDAPFAADLAKGAPCPLFSVLFSLPRISIASYLGKGLAGSIALGLGYASGVDYGDPSIERVPGLIFIILWLLGIGWLFVGLLPLLALKLKQRVGTTR